MNSKGLLVACFLIAFYGSLAQKAAKARDHAIPYTLKIDKEISDSALVDLVQKQTIRYFWDFAHPVSGLARERSNESFH